MLRDIFSKKEGKIMANNWGFQTGHDGTDIQELQRRRARRPEIRQCLLQLAADAHDQIFTPEEYLRRREQVLLTQA